MPVSKQVIWNYIDVTTDIPAPSPFPLQIGTNTKGITVYNISPYWIDLKEQYQNDTIVTIQPWCIFPMELDAIGQIWIECNTEFTLMPNTDGTVTSNQQVFVILNTAPPSDQVRILNVNQYATHNCTWRVFSQYRWNDLKQYGSFSALANP